MRDIYSFSIFVFYLLIFFSFRAFPIFLIASIRYEVLQNESQFNRRNENDIKFLKLRKLKAYSGHRVSPYGKTLDTAKI